jgi:hypothetical protein
MIITALALTAALQTHPGPDAQPVKLDIGCGYSPGAGMMFPILVGDFKDDATGFRGRAYATMSGWGPLADTPFSAAADRDWYRENTPLTVGGRQYVKYGLPRPLGRTDVVWFAEHDGVVVAAEPGQTAPEVVYVLVTPEDCGFQPYQQEQ